MFMELKDVGKNCNSCPEYKMIDVGNKSCNSQMHTDKTCGSACNVKSVTDKYNCEQVLEFSKFTFFHRMLNEKEIKLDSNERELIAGKETIFGALPLIKNSSVTIQFDNLNATLILKKGSSKIRLHEHAIQVDKFCIRNNILYFYFQAGL